MKLFKEFCLNVKNGYFMLYIAPHNYDFTQKLSNFLTSTESIGLNFILPILIKAGINSYKPEKSKKFFPNFLLNFFQKHPPHNYNLTFRNHTRYAWKILHFTTLVKMFLCTVPPISSWFSSTYRLRSFAFLLIINGNVYVNL